MEQEEGEGTLVEEEGFMGEEVEARYCPIWQHFLLPKAGPRVALRATAKNHYTITPLCVEAAV